MSSEDSVQSQTAIMNECPDCGGRLQHQTRESTMCLDCETVYAHEIRTGGRHYLWLDGEMAAKEVV